MICKAIKNFQNEKKIKAEIFDIAFNFVIDPKFSKVF